jgi:hypothetical protein
MRGLLVLLQEMEIHSLDAIPSCSSNSHRVRRAYLRFWRLLWEQQPYTGDLILLLRRFELEETPLPPPLGLRRSVGRQKAKFVVLVPHLWGKDEYE